MPDDNKNPLSGLGKTRNVEEHGVAEAPVPNRRLTVREQGGANSLLNHPPKAVNGSSASITRSGDEPAERYSSHPIANFRLGRFHFDRGLLQLDADDAAEFEGMLDQLPLTERRRIVKLDVKAAERLIAENAARRSGATQNFDSSVGERAGKHPVGTEDLGHASRSQQDANAVVDVTTGETPPAEETAGKVVPHEA